MNKVLLVFFFIFLYISLVGAFNWGLIGASKFNLVEFISNRNKRVEQTIYLLVGFSSIVAFILSLIIISSSENYMYPDYMEFYEERDLNE